MPSSGSREGKNRWKRVLREGFKNSESLEEKSGKTSGGSLNLGAGKEFSGKLGLIHCWTGEESVFWDFSRQLQALKIQGKRVKMWERDWRICSSLGLEGER